MNTTLKTLGACLMISLAPTTHAASTTDLTVKGLIVPSACTPSLSNAGTVDFGKRPFKDLNPTQMTILPLTDLQLNVACDAQTLLALDPTDNRAESGTYATYGIGLVNGGQRLGGYYLTLRNAIADSLALETVKSSDSGATWQWHGPADAWQPALIVAPSLPTVAAPIPVKDMSITLGISAFINRSDSLPGSEEIPIDGSAMITVRYL